jgi:serine/threonine-protein kinase
MTVVGPQGELRRVAETSKPKVCPTCGNEYLGDAIFCSLDGAPLASSRRSSDAASDPYLGREILGHIEIRQLVGIGSMGRVYRAIQRGIDRNVAVKILHRELSANETLVARFRREAKVASRIAHPNVVNVLLAGQLPDGALYIVMEYVDGVSLQSALAAAGGAMPLPRALHIAMQLCDAVGEAHAQGIVHRDLKPENVMLIDRAEDPDFVKMLDFGIARLTCAESSVATAAGLIFGTARYISPEGAKGEPVSPRGDVYSLAVMLYQMLAGRTPFEASQTVALLLQHIHDPPPPLRGVARAAYVPDAVAAVIMANLAKAPFDRAEDARAFGRALLESAVISGLGAQDILGRPALAAGRRGSHASAVQMPSLQRTKKHSLDADTSARLAESSATPRGAETVKWSVPRGIDAKLAAPPAPAMGSPSSVEITLAGDRTSLGAARARALPFAIALLCAGVLALAAVAWKTRRSGSGSAHHAMGIESARAPAPVSAAPSQDAVLPAPTLAASDGAIPPLANLHPAPFAGATTSSGRAILEASSSRPGLGQPVDFSARVLNAPGGVKAKPEGGRFRISGPGLATGTELPASDEGSGVFRTTFTFLQTGRFEIEFSARASGAPVRTVKVIVVGESPLPPAPAPANTTTAPPNPNTRWL